MINKSMLYLVTNGTEYAYWNSGHWDSTTQFEGKCLLDDDSASDAQRDLNKGLEDADPAWDSKEVWIEVNDSSITTVRNDSGFASLRTMAYVECPCGCGSKEICETQRENVKAHNDAIPY